MWRHERLREATACPSGGDLVETELIDDEQVEPE
jgi:hypothetical protein